MLLDIARRSLRHGLACGAAPGVDLGELPPRLRQPRASFVTLIADGRLRGCIGSLEATRPLVVDVAENAWAAAFRDPRFPSLSAGEEPATLLRISLLTAPEPIDCRDRVSLLRQLNPGVDGVIIERNGRRATFLPDVWEQLPDRCGFLSALENKAGIDPGAGGLLRAWRYRTECLEESRNNPTR